MTGLFLLMVVPSLTFQEGLTILKERSPYILGAYKDVEIAQEKYYQSLSSFYPSVNLQSSYTRMTNIPVIEMQTPQGTMDVPMGEPDNYQNALSISLPLFMSGKRMIIEKLADVGLQSSKLNKVQKERKLVDNFIQVYYSLLMSLKSKSLSEEALKNAEEHLKVTNAQFKEGSATDLDRIRAEKDVYQAKAGIIQADNGIKSLYRALNNLLGFPIDSIYPVEESQDSSAFDLPVDSVVSEALKNREEVKVIENALRSAELNVKMNISSFFPDFVFWSNVGYNKPIGFEDKWGWDVKLGVSLSLPVFSGFSNIHKLKEAKRNLEKLKINENVVKRSIEMEIRELYDKLKEAEEQLKVQGQNLKLSKRSLDMAKEQYRMGYITHTDYRDIELGYISAKFGYLSAEFNYRINLEKLKNAIRRY